uniref:Dynein axonemal heavy chain 1 n=1 Tax=Equus asinus TaxID=9793 RepID=A0A9L0J1V5_EQUAS
AEGLPAAGRALQQPRAHLWLAHYQCRPPVGTLSPIPGLEEEPWLCSHIRTQLTGGRALAFVGQTEQAYEKLSRMVKDFQPYLDLWTTASDWLRWSESWMNDPLSAIDAEQLEKNVIESFKTMHKCVKQFKDIPGRQPNIRARIEEFKPYIPLIQGLRNPGMRNRHWDVLSNEININVRPKANLTFARCLEMNLQDHIESISKVAEVALDKMEKEWSTILFNVLPYKETDTYILKSPDEASQLLDDHIVMTQSMSFSPYKKPFEQRISSWENKLKLTQEVLEEWLNCQRSWLYLEPIFSSEDINRQLPVESKRYQTMERIWRKIMKNAYENREVINVCSDQRLLDSLRDCNKLLDMVQKGLSEYLETKRSAFPRFYFLSDDELLEILSQTKDPTAVQPHLRKCFENIARLLFQEDLEITHMYSAEGEEVQLSFSIYPSSNVEDWLREVENSMKASVRDIIERAIKAYPTWVLNWPGQVTIAGCQTYWTMEVAEALEANNLTPHWLSDLVALVRGKLSRMHRAVLSALIVIEVHAKDVVSKLIQENVVSVNDFEWISQLRYYWTNNNLYIRAVNAEFIYGYEYLGNSGRLVITPLTDRCYLTLTGALHLKFGGAPAGPAGTGKTETTKDLGKALAIQTVVFNCSDQLDFMAMGKFFKGLASAGAWACFDEFNRIDIEVLSVVAQQITTIQKAQQQRVERFMFEGVEIPLVPSCAVFITMNPGYAGRTELPDNLKALFRPVAMMVPDYAMIAEISLYSFGFNEANVLAKKITTTFKLSSEQLSSQDHYDFGMRAVKTVISAAGNLKRENPSMNELICLRAIRDVNVPKFLQEDLKLFSGIVSDLFPTIKEEETDYGILDKAIRKACEKNNLKDVDGFLTKCIQLYETTVVRHGLMLVGPTGSGKSNCYRVLAAAMTSLKGQPSISGGMYEAVNYYVLNPKSITMGQLYGEFDLLTHEWTDGIFSSLIRAGAIASDTNKKWYMFDGPVDAVWIENMNTVLDDNKKLCLSSGEIINSSWHQAMTMMFEVQDLAVASPATVSRCGMVYLEPSILGLMPFVECWLRRLPALLKPYEEKFKALFVSFLEVSEATVRPAQVEQQDAVRCAESSISGGLFWKSPTLCGEGAWCFLFLSEAAPHLGPLAKAWQCSNFPSWCTWQGFGWQGVPGPPLSHLWFQVAWVKWMDSSASFTMVPDTSYCNIIVPTMDTVQMSYLLGMLLTNHKPVLCIGPTGTGKTLTISDKLLKNLPLEYISHFLSFSARTSANQTQDLIDSKLDKRRKGVFGPPLGRNFIFFIDDLNMPALETYGAQPPIELLRQWMDHGGWYDRKIIGNLVDINFICAMGPPGGGRNAITPRLTRHFNYLSFAEMDEVSKKPPNIAHFTDPLVEATIMVYSTITSQLLPTPAKSHYTFNLRDLSKVFQGMLMANPVQLLRLWYHESCRVFRDRLVNQEDRNWFDKLLESHMERWEVAFNEVCPFQPILYGDFMSPGCDVKSYELITSEKKVRGPAGALPTVIEEYVEDYNQINTAKLKLVLFVDAMSHICRISRTLRQALGNALLLGVGGSGRSSLTRLASHMAEYECFQIELSKNYGMTEWREDVKKVLLKAGLHSLPITFLFSDTQIKNESFLEDINNILNSGDIPNLYTLDEQDQIVNTMRPCIQEQGLQPTKANLMAAYTGRVRSNIHMVLCMSPIGEVFRARLRQFPSLVNCCTIDWFNEWPAEALESVATKFLNEIPELEVCVYVHQSVARKCVEYLAELARHNYVTPKSYLELLNIFSIFIGQKKQELKTAKNRMKSGLDKLLRTSEDVAKMQEELEIMRPLLEEAAKDTTLTMEQIKVGVLSGLPSLMSDYEPQAEADLKGSPGMPFVCGGRDLVCEAHPVRQLSLPRDTHSVMDLLLPHAWPGPQVRAMQRPPPGVKLVIEAVCIMKGIKPKKVPGEKPGSKVDDYWEPGKGLLQDPGRFLESLFKFDKDNIGEAVIKAIQPYIDNEEFQPAAIAKVSKACTSICQWVRAMHKYHFVAKAVEPKRVRQALREAQDDLEVTQRILEEAKQRLREVEDGIAMMQTKYRECIAKKEELELKCEQCEQRLSRADKLINGLSDERVRWQETVENLEHMLDNIFGDVLVAAGFVAYLGPFTVRWPQTCLGQPHLSKRPCLEPTLIGTLGNPVKIRSWQIAGLPNDTLSVENGVINQYSQRWTHFIDPQGQANKWIKNMEKDSGLDVFKLSDRDFLRSMENAIRFGKPCLLENVGEELDPALEPVLLKQTYKQQGNTVLKLGDTVIPYHEDFRMYITTKLPNPHYTPEISTKLTLINFTLTQGVFPRLRGSTSFLPGTVAFQAFLSPPLTPLTCHCFYLRTPTPNPSDPWSGLPSLLGQLAPPLSDTLPPSLSPCWAFMHSLPELSWSPESDMFWLLAPKTCFCLCHHEHRHYGFCWPPTQNPQAPQAPQAPRLHTRAETGPGSLGRRVLGQLPGMGLNAHMKHGHQVHRDFRLWLTSLPSNKFPVSILQNGSKMTIEPPRGVKANLLKSYSSLSDDFLNSCHKVMEFKSLLLSLCLFHGNALERRKFGPLGFNIPYEFTDGDLRICISQLKMFLDEYDDIPYKVLKYTAGEINYGGRVTDDWDRRCVMNILEDFYSPEVLFPEHSYSASGVYHQIQPTYDLSGYLSYIKGLPLNDMPEIFGLHDNANITFAQNETYALLTLTPSVSLPLQIVEEVAQNILIQVPEPINLQMVMTKYPVLYEESMNTVLVQEVIRYNRLLQVITQTLRDLLKALKGLVVMSSQLELMAASLYNNTVPELWNAKAYPSLKPLSSWVMDLLQRLDFLQAWIQGGIPAVFWISGFFFPQAFLTGTLQNFARKSIISIDTISFDFKVWTQPQVGCYIHGLFLEGARWDPVAFQLAESRPKELYTEMAVIWLLPIPNRKIQDQDFYLCPIYKTLTRAGTLSTTGHSTNYIIAVEIPTDQPQRHWIKRGVALICALDY